ncbi:hypothetical protein [Sorangium sp. So ce1151]|uniref:hypothetical protein n=1 Tax=Sorangium sp. So ce1151 TaxID=3133332 RepID=UPI003F5DAFFC
MPRRPTGSLFRNAADRLYVRVLIGDNDRESFPLDPRLTEKQAEQRKELVADLAARLRASRNVTRDAIVALLDRAAVREGGFLNREGTRISEAARLQVQDVDLDRGALRLEKNKSNDPRA